MIYSFKNLRLGSNYKFEGVQVQISKLIKTSWILYQNNTLESRRPRSYKMSLAAIRGHLRSKIPKKDQILKLDKIWKIISKGRSWRQLLNKNSSEVTRGRTRWEILKRSSFELIWNYFKLLLHANFELLRFDHINSKSRHSWG